MDQDPSSSAHALAELAQVNFSEHSMATLMERVAALAKRCLPATEVSVTLVERDSPSTVAFTGRLALDLDERQYADERGPCLDSIAAGQHVVVSDTSSERRWPEWSAEAMRSGVRSSLSVPVPMQREVTAALNIYSRDADGFDAGDVELAEKFAAFAGVALSNMHGFESQTRTAEQMQEAMRSRAVIEQAKGIVMAREGCGAKEAFDRLVMISQQENRKLREVAERLVAEVSAAQSEGVGRS